MKSIFSYDSPLIQFLSRIFDLIILNLLFLLCMVPVVTGGAGLTAMYRVLQNMVYKNDDNGVVKPFFRAFRENFKAVTPIWLLFVVATLSVVCDFLLIRMLDGAPGWYAAAGVLAVLVLGSKCFFFPLAARYDNPPLLHLRNALVLAVSNLPRTLLMIFLELLPVVLFFVDLEVLYYVLLFWPVLGFSCVAYIETAFMLKKTFSRFEPAQEAEQPEETEE